MYKNKGIGYVVGDMVIGYRNYPLRILSSNHRFTGNYGATPLVPPFYSFPAHGF
jgi:hypothetical protein